MSLELKNYDPALMYGADISVSAADLSIDDLTVGDDATITGDLAVSGTITGGSSSNIAINTNKFTVAASSGNTLVAGTLDVTGASALAGAVNFKRQVTDTGGAYATPVVLTTAQSGRVLLVDDAAGLDFTLPAIAAGDIGTHFQFAVTVTITSNNFRVTAASGDLLFGALWMADFDTANTGAYFTADGTDDLVLTMNGSTTGGKKGTWVEFIATSATQWFVKGNAFGDGSLATPFS